MAVIERDVVLISKDANGKETIDFPLARLGNIEGDADIKAAPEAADYIPLMDSSDRGQMKKAPASAFMGGGNIAEHTGNTNNPHNVTKAQVGLSNVDNTSDADKPVSNAVQAELDRKANSSHTHPAGDITGTLSVANGGTGAASASGARDNLGAAAKENPVFTGSISMGRKAGTTVGGNSVTEGYETTASGNYSHAEGYQTIASGYTSHAEGTQSKASGITSHAEGSQTTAQGNFSHAEGFQTKALSEYSHAEGSGSTASGAYSHAEGSGKALGSSAHAEGFNSTASGIYSHAEGNYTTASGSISHSEGYQTIASGDYSHVEGYHTTASNFDSHAGGKYNKEMTTGGNYNNTTGDVFVIGNGTDVSARSNAFRVTYAGAVYGKSAFNSTGADYAEYFEWSDGNPNNEDRVGYFVTLEGKKIRIANLDDYILGIVSGQPCIIGNADEDWLGRWEHDEFGRFIIEDVDTPITEWREVQVPILDDKGNPIQQTKMELQTETITNEDGTTETITKEVLVPVMDYEGNPVYETRPEMQEFETGESIMAGGTRPIRSMTTRSNT